MFVAALSVGMSRGQVQEDDFSDGDDSGWIHYDPFEIAGAGPVVTFDESGGTYRLASPPSPVPAVGPARGAAFRPDQYTDFCMSIDVPVYDPGLEQAFGILARVGENPAPGNVFGYAMTYHPFDNDIQITRLNNEVIVEISPYIALSAPPASGVLRLVFMGQGDRFVGRAYDAANPVVPLAETMVTDTVYSSGMCGIAVIDNTEAGDQAADATFDNYYAGADVAVPLAIGRESGGDLLLSWRFPFYHHWVVRSPQLDPWVETPLVSALPDYANGTFTLATPVSAGGPKSFFLLNRQPLP